MKKEGVALTVGLSSSDVDVRDSSVIENRYRIQEPHRLSNHRRFQLEFPFHRIESNLSVPYVSRRTVKVHFFNI